MRRWLLGFALVGLGIAQIQLPQYRGVVAGGSKFTYYVDSSRADDTGNGLTPATAWKTVAKVNSTTLTAGQSVGFKRGGLWRETLTPGQSGTAGHPITFGAYGSGARPTISGADLVTGWTLEPIGKMAVDANTVALWDFNGNLNDASSHARTLTAGNTAAYTTGYYDQAFSGGKYASYADNQSGDSNAFDFGNTTSFTIEAWVQLTSGSTAFGVIACKGINGVTRWELDVQRNGASSYFQAFAYNGAQNPVVTYNPGSAALFDNGWHHIAMRVDWANTVDHNLTLWVDGVSRGTPVALSGAAYDNSYAFTAGAKSDGGSVNPFPVDQLRVSNVARTTFPTVTGSPVTAYYKALAAQPAIVLENSTGYSSVAAKASLVPSTFWWDSGNTRVYVRTSGDNDPAGYTMEASVRALAIDPNGKDYLAFKDLYIYGAGAQTLLEGSADHVTLSNVRLGYSVFEGVSFGAPTTRAAITLGAHQLLNNAYPIGATAQATLISSLGGKVSRSNLDWSQIEAVQGVRDWAGPDAAVAACQATGMEPLFVIFQSPQWANGSANPAVVPGPGAAFTAWVSAYTSFIQAATARYHGSVKKWELWNEPNIYVHWAEPTNPVQADYITWASAMYTAMKAIDSSLQIVSTSGSESAGDGTTVIPGTTWLSALYAASFFADGHAIHPYSYGAVGPTNPAPDSHTAGVANFDDIALIRAVMVGAGRSNDLLWATEWGWGTSLAGQSTTTQALNTLKSLQMMKDLYPYVSLGTIFNDVDNSGQSAPYSTMGLYTDVPVKKKAARVFREFISLWAGAY